VTPSHDPADPREQDTPLTPEEEAEVAALLAETVGRTPVEVPPDVAARLDEVLAGLVAERRTEPSKASEPSEPSAPERVGATVLPLAPRRRRLPRALLAAAAVVVGGYAVGNLALDGSLLGTDGGSADSAGGGDDSAGGASQADEAEPLGGDRRGDGARLVPPVRKDHLAADVRRVVDRFGKSPSPDALLGESDRGAGGVEEASDCPLPRLTDAQRLYLVRYQRSPAGLVVGPRHEGRVDVTVYSCRDGGVRLSRTVPAP
jgi:hypothetical protein